MTMKKIILLFCCLCLTALCAPQVCAKGCETPKKALQAYYNAVLANDFETAYDLLSQSDKNVKSYDDYIGLNYFDNPIMGYVNSRSSYKVEKIKTDGDSGLAVVMVKEPDGENINTFVYRQFIAHGMNNLSEEEALERMLKLLADAEFDLHRKKVEVLLLKDAEGWHVFFDWEYQAKRTQLLMEAQELSYSQIIETLRKAKALYAEIRQMPGNENDMYFVNAMWSIERKIEHLQACMALLEVYDVQTAFGEDRPGEIYLQYDYKIRNNNTAIVNKIIMQIEVLDGDGNAIYNEVRELAAKEPEANENLAVIEDRGQAAIPLPVKREDATTTIKVRDVILY